MQPFIRTCIFISNVNSLIVFSQDSRRIKHTASLPNWIKKCVEFKKLKRNLLGRWYIVCIMLCYKLYGHSALLNVWYYHFAHYCRIWYLKCYFPTEQSIQRTASFPFRVVITVVREVFSLLPIIGKYSLILYIPFLNAELRQKIIHEVVTFLQSFSLLNSNILICRWLYSLQTDYRHPIPGMLFAN